MWSGSLPVQYRVLRPTAPSLLVGSSNPCLSPHLSPVSRNCHPSYAIRRLSSVILAVQSESLFRLLYFETMASLCSPILTKLRHPAERASVYVYLGLEYDQDSQARSRRGIQNQSVQAYNLARKSSL